MAYTLRLTEAEQAQLSKYMAAKSCKAATKGFVLAIDDAIELISERAKHDELKAEHQSLLNRLSESAGMLAELVEVLGQKKLF